MKFIEMSNDSHESNEQNNPNLSKDEQTPMVHYYRAEIGRLVVYKQRMDTTIFWLLSFSLFLWSSCIQGWFSANITLYMLIVITFFLQLMDINRYKSYYKIKYRCKIMEDGMYTCIFDQAACRENWKKLLVQSWTTNVHELSNIKSFALRFRNVFVYFYICNIVIYGIYQFN